MDDEQTLHATIDAEMANETPSAREAAHAAVRIAGRLVIAAERQAAALERMAATAEWFAKHTHAK